MVDIKKAISAINIDKAVKQGMAFVKDNLPAIFSASAVGCLGLAVYETAKATHKSDKDISEEEARRVTELPLYENTALSTLEKIDLCWRNYIPAAFYTGACAAFIIAAERKGNEKYLALMSAYELTRKAGEERKDVERDIFGEDKVKEIDTAVRQRFIDSVEPKDIQNDSVNGDKKLFYEPWTNSTFWATDDDVLHAFNHMNHIRQKQGAASPNDLVYDCGCRCAIAAADYGWNEDQPVIEPILTETTLVCGMPAVVIGYSIDPAQNYGIDRYQG